MKIQIALVLIFAIASAQTGGWKKQNVTVFQATNSNIVNEAQQAVENKYSPEEQGYEFQQIVSVETQVVAGVNYNIVLQYDNEEGQTQQYEVIIYSAPWTGADQITKCEQINGTATNFVSTTQDAPVQQTIQENLIKTIKPSVLGLRVRQQQNTNTGGWQTVNPKVFEATNDSIITLATQTVAQQYNPAAQGFEFDEVTSVKTQVVSGTNYNIQLVYTNGKGDYQTYDVQLYICPWNPSANQSKATFTGQYSV